MVVRLRCVQESLRGRSKTRRQALLRHLLDRVYSLGRKAKRKRFGSVEASVCSLVSVSVGRVNNAYFRFVTWWSYVVGVVQVKHTVVKIAYRRSIDLRICF